MVEIFVNELEAENLGVEITVSPIPSHIYHTYVDVKAIPNHFGDPIDLSSGAFTEVVDAMSVSGGTQLAVALNYDSRHSRGRRCLLCVRCGEQPYRHGDL